MSSHVLIQNKGELPIWGIRLLGLSDKDETQIGQFGTGLKESIALMARMGLFPTIYSGTCRTEFSIRQFSGQDEICFRLSEQRDHLAPNEWHGLGIHPNFGKADWNDPWMIFREILCNALDASGLDDLVHDVQSGEMFGVEGSTRIYIPTNPKILAAYATVHDKLLPLGNYDIIQCDAIVGTAIAKRDAETVQIYYRGVWVQQGTKKKSLFDYELQTLKLNESRSADWWDVNNRVAMLVAQYTKDQAAALLEELIVTKNGECYEASVLNSAEPYADIETSRNWVEAFAQVFGDDAVLSDNTSHYYDQLRDKGHKPIVVDDEILRKFLKKTGIPHAAKVLTKEQYDYQSVDQPDERLQILFNQAWNLFDTHSLTNDKTKPGLMTFIPRNGDASIQFGAYRNDICYINSEHAETQMEKMAVFEELAHHITGAYDMTRALQTFLVKCAVEFAA